MNQFPAGTCLCGRKERHLSRALPPSLYHQTSEVKSAARLWEVSEEAEGLKGAADQALTSLDMRPWTPV